MQACAVGDYVIRAGEIGRELFLLSRGLMEVTPAPFMGCLCLHGPPREAVFTCGESGCVVLLF